MVPGRLPASRGPLCCSDGFYPSIRLAVKQASAYARAMVPETNAKLIELRQIPIVLLVFAMMLGGLALAYDKGHNSKDDGARGGVTQTYPDYGTGGFYEK